MDSIFITSIFFEDSLKQIFLGIIQGLTEFLPISSTAHLIIIPHLLGWNDPGITTIASIQLGSIIAVFIYFWRDINNIIVSFLHFYFKRGTNNSKPNLAWSIVIGNIPIILVGIFIKLHWHSYEYSFLRNPLSIGVVSIIMAFILALSEKIGTRLRKLDQINIIDGLYIGFSQVLALIPGVSRSGITISSALLSGIDRSSSARFSFLLGIPAISLSGIVELKTALSEFSIENIILLFIGIFSAGITSWLSIDFLLKFLKKYSILTFVYYRLAFGILILAIYFH